MRIVASIGNSLAWTLDMRAIEDTRNLRASDAKLLQSVVRRDRKGVESALSQGADAKLVVCGVPVLFIAAANADLPIVRDLVDGGADVCAMDNSGDPILTVMAITARTDRHAAVMKYLISAGAKLNQEGGRYTTPLDTAVVYGNVLSAQVLIEAGANEGMLHRCSVGHPTYVAGANVMRPGRS